MNKTEPINTLHSVVLSPAQLGDDGRLGTGGGGDSLGPILDLECLVDLEDFVDMFGASIGGLGLGRSRRDNARS